MAQGGVTQIPFSGGSGRVPTGAIQFEQDWPGLFVRGDEAGFLLLAIRRVERQLGGLPLALAEVAQIIERDVAVGDTPPQSLGKGAGA